MNAQLTFAAIDEAARAEERRQRDALDRHRQRVQTWFDENLSEHDKDQLAEWFELFEWDTCAALAAAAGHHSISRAANDRLAADL